MCGRYWLVSCRERVNSLQSCCTNTASPVSLHAQPSTRSWGGRLELMYSIGILGIYGHWKTRKHARCGAQTAQVFGEPRRWNEQITEKQHDFPTKEPQFLFPHFCFQEEHYVWVLFPMAPLLPLGWNTDGDVCQVPCPITLAGSTLTFLFQTQGSRALQGLGARSALRDKGGDGQGSVQGCHFAWRALTSRTS